MNSADEWPYSIPVEDRFRFVEERTDPVNLVTRTGSVDYDETVKDIHARLYDGAVRYLDRHVQRIVDELRSTGQWEDTLLVITADHGELLGDRGLLGHGYLYEPGVHVPLVVSPAKGLEVAEVVTNRRVNTIGLFGTLARVAGIEPPRASGVDLLSNESQRDVLVQDYSNTWDWSRYGGDETGRHCLYHDDWKLHRTPKGMELYDLESDPNETNDLSAAEPAVLEELSVALQSRLDELDLADEPTASTVDERATKRLSDLGYLE